MAKFSFCPFMDWDEVKVHKNAKREQFTIWHSTPSCCSVFLLLRLPVFVTKSILKTHQHFCFLCFHSRKRFQCSRILVPSRQRNHRKSIYCHGKYFAKESFLAPARIWTSAKSYYGNKTGNPKRAVSGSILPTGVANHSAGFDLSSPLMELVKMTHQPRSCVKTADKSNGNRPLSRSR